MSNRGQTLESWIHYVYDMLLNLRNDGVSVQRDVKLVGRSKVLHQIDVYYEFSRAGLKHRVAIECKDHNRPITKGDIQEFHGKLFVLFRCACVTTER